MALITYKKKRSFADTPEPKGGKSVGSQLRFVIHKHRARALHYDLRLELGGVLKSWAVPKGPSMDPAVKRLAMAVEDHPIDYKDFEGVIPKGNYGAGEVIIWDEGTYEPVDDVKGKAAQARVLLKQYREGSLKVKLNGKKLAGEFALVKTKGMDENAWLLIKHNDDYAGKSDVTKQDRSVRSGKRVDDLSGQTSPPTTLSPMLATLVNEPFDDPQWEFEVKWDGYRTIAFIDGNTVELKSRNGNSFDERFPPVYEAVKQWGIRAIVDGEVVAIGRNGVPHFNTLQHWNGQSDASLLYYVFDLLWLDGNDYTHLPLDIRQAKLRALVPDKGIIRMGMSVKEKGTEFLEAAAKLGLEGIIAKRLDSRYLPSQRTKDWLKIKAQKRQEVVIGGYTRKAGSSRLISSLLLGVYDDGKLRYAGKVGTGFTEKSQRELLAKFKQLVRKTSPFVEGPNLYKPSLFHWNTADTSIVWLSPKLVCEVHYSEVTSDGVFRHPSFIALREDKSAREVVLEKAIPMKHEKQAIGKDFLKTAKHEVTKKINGETLQFTNLDKVYWPEEGYTKRDMLNYYDAVASYILPYLKGRPQSLNRFPDGIKGENFFQKDVTGKVPDWVELFPYKTEEDDTQKHYMLCNDRASLLLMANMGAIELHPWSSTIKKPDHPDWCMLDIDPDKGNTFEQVIQVAQAIKAILDDIAIPGYCKTSGATGLHVYIPLGAKYTYDQSQLFAKWVAHRVNDELPDFTSVARMLRKRKGKIYIDYLQNRYAATLAAPYSLRPKPGATVSMPLHWEEVKKGLNPTDFTIANTQQRLESEGDIFKPVLKKGIDLKRALAKASDEL